MKTIFFLILMGLRISAAELTLVWNANPAEDEITEYRIWRQTGPEAWTLQAATAGDVTQITLTLPAGRHTFCFTALNVWGESDRSDPVSTPPVPSKVKGGKVQGVKISLQMSRDLKTWVPVMSAEVPWEEVQFFRTVF